MKFQSVVFSFLFLLAMFIFPACPGSKKSGKQESQNTTNKEIPADLAPSNAKRKVQNILNGRENKMRKRMDQIKNAH